MSPLKYVFTEGKVNFMPSERFHRLPKEKQETIWRATLNEFKRVPPEEISINRIIKEADISRGSFYTYFSDKKELLEWVIFDYIKSYQDLIQKGMAENNGDIWKALDMVFESVVDEISSEDLTKLIKNLVNSPSFPAMIRRGLIENDFPDEISREVVNNSTFTLLNPDVCSVDEEGFEMLMDLWTMSFIYMLKNVFCDGVPLDEARRRYRKYLDLLRYGAG